MSYPGPGAGGGIVSPGNVTSAPLGGGGTFTGVWEEVTDYASISVVVSVTLPAATGTLKLEFSTDGGATIVGQKDIPVTTAAVHVVVPVASHFRVEYVNDGTAQTTFDLQTVYGTQARIAQQTSQLQSVPTDTQDIVTTRAILSGPDATGLYHDAQVQPEGYLSVDIASPRSAFGEIQTADPIPFTQLKFTNGLIPGVVRTQHALTGSVAGTAGFAVVGTGAGAGGIARLTSTRIARYATGQGIEVRFTSVFTSGVAGTTQWSGVGDEENAIAFGMNGTTLAVLRRTGGQVEIRQLTVTAASTGPGNITITLNGGTGVVVAIAGVLTIGEVAKQIASADYSDEGGGFVAQYAGNRVIFRSVTAESRGGAYSFAGGATGATGAFSTIIVGSTPSEYIVDQADWNKDPADGTLVLPQIIPTFGNVYRIQYQWLGFGAIFFSIENPPSGRFETVHIIEYANANTLTTLRQPDMPLMLEAKNLAVASDIVVKSPSMAVFNLGHIIPTGPDNTPYATRSIGTSFTLLIAFRLKSLNLAGVTNKIDTLIRSISYGNAAGKPATFRLWRNPTIVGSPTFSDLSATTSTIEVSTNGTSLSGGELRLVTAVGAGNGSTLQFDDGKEFIVAPGELWAIDAAVFSGAADTLSASLRIIEEV